MKGNRELDDLLLSYILKELNEEEEAFVVEYIRSDESNRKHFEQVRNTWKAITIERELDRVDTDQEWEIFEKRIQREKQQLVAIRQEKEAEVLQYAPEPAGGGRRRVFAWAVAAAAVLAVVVAVWRSGQNGHPAAEVAGRAIRTEKALPEIKRVVNSSGHSERVALPDGSLVLLEDKSEIDFTEGFAADKRDVTLSGKAEFKVAQDKSRPFTVYSLGLATTALGTSFTVAAYEQAESIVIRLNEGRIVVRPAAQGTAKLKQDYYLAPGQSLVYNTRNYTAKLLDAGKKNSRTATEKKREEAAYTDLPDMPENSKGSWYMFNNESLAQVFDQLAMLYNTEIVYEKKDMHNLYFAGKFDKADSLSMILRQIATVNNLKVEKRNNKFIITK